MIRGVPDEDGVYYQSVAEASSIKMKVGELRDLVSADPDFAHEPPRIQRMLEERGHLGLWMPKYHCECCYIELCWCLMKQQLRKRLAGRVVTVHAFFEAYLQNVRVEALLPLRARSELYKEAYRNGMDGPQAAAHVDKLRADRRKVARKVARKAGPRAASYTSHRRPVGSTEFEM